MDSERKQRFIGVLERRIASRSTMSASWYIWTVLRPIYHLNSKVYDKVDASAVAYEIIRCCVRFLSSRNTQTKSRHFFYIL